MGNMKDLNSAHHCSSSFFWRIVPRYERITARNHGQIVGILSQAGYHQGWSALAQNLIHFWSVDTPPENKHSCRPVEELMGDDDPKHIICSHWKPKKCGWFIISQNFCRGSKRLVFYQKLGQFDWIFSSTTHWKSNSAAGQPRMVPTVWHRKNGGGKQGEKTWPTKDCAAHVHRVVLRRYHAVCISMVSDDGWYGQQFYFIWCLLNIYLNLC